MSQSMLTRILQLLIDNKKFPSYQAERRIDIFINYFLERVLTGYFNTKVKYICPEFPIKKINNNSSTKLDYLCATKNEIIFVELKTDNSSLKPKQADIYLSCEWSKCKLDLEEIINSLKNKAYKEKYNSLKSTINTIEYFDSEPPIRVIYISPFPKPDSNFSQQLKITNHKKLSECYSPEDFQEIELWAFLTELNLSVFEISKHII